MIQSSDFHVHRRRVPKFSLGVVALPFLLATTVLSVGCSKPTAPFEANSVPVGNFDVNEVVELLHSGKIKEPIEVILDTANRAPDFDIFAISEENFKDLTRDQKKRAQEEMIYSMIQLKDFFRKSVALEEEARASGEIEVADRHRSSWKILGDYLTSAERLLSLQQLGNLLVSESQKR